MNEFGETIKMLQLLSDEQLMTYLNVYIRQIYSEENQPLDDGVKELTKLAKFLGEGEPSREKFALATVLTDLKEEKVIDDNTFNNVFSLIF